MKWLWNLDFSGQEYDRYGFVKKYDFESGEFDPVTLEAQKLERKSSEVSDKVKAREKRFCFLFFFKLFSVYIYQNKYWKSNNVFMPECAEPIL